MMEESIQEAVNEVASKFDVGGTDSDQVLRRLVDRHLVSADLAIRIGQVRSLRNMAVHLSDSVLGYSRAEAIVRLGLGVLGELNEIRER